MAHAETLKLDSSEDATPEAPKGKASPKPPAPRATGRTQPAQAGAATDASSEEADPEAAHTAHKWYRVEEDQEVPTRGGKYMLRKGKDISDKGYDIEVLLRAGVKLKQIDEPRWHAHLQKTGESLAV